MLTWTGHGRRRALSRRTTDAHTLPFRPAAFAGRGAWGVGGPHRAVQPEHG
jgi:hypothetical protein